ncbi:MAG TPA: hypothetical protein ENO20_06400 [Bacteroides sp.]|nr:hypothetical protein [Bacteroides sp.]
MKLSNCRIGRPGRLVIISLSCFILLFFNQLHAQDIEKDILGKWALESTGDAYTGGSINFLDGSSYAFQKEFPDATKAELKGGYLLDAGSSPARLRLCLGDCSTAGSEWTSEFCILRLAGDGKLEIYMSSTGDYPGKFPEDRNAERMYVFVREN